MARLPKTSSGILNTIRLLLKVAKPFLQLAVFILAFWISLTRISDYYHHPLDVAIGSLVGIMFACLISYTSGLATRELAFQKSENFGDKDLENGTAVKLMRGESNKSVHKSDHRSNHPDRPLVFKSFT